MVEGPDADGSDDLIIEMKPARRSALDGVVPTGDLDPGDRAERSAEGRTACSCTTWSALPREAAKRVKSNWKSFRRDYPKGAFSRSVVRYD
jgi:hypothetical protein